jgi:hypothetical protein
VPCHCLFSPRGIRESSLGWNWLERTSAGPNRQSRTQQTHAEQRSSRALCIFGAQSQTKHRQARGVSTHFRHTMARGNQRDKAREAAQKKLAAQVRTDRTSRSYPAHSARGPRLSADIRQRRISNNRCRKRAARNLAMRCRRTRRLLRRR